MYWIGVDPGVHTGVAVWNAWDGRLCRVETRGILAAIELVKWYCDAVGKERVRVVFEDARQRKWFGGAGTASARIQGAGSVKRDCGIWEEFCTAYGIQHEAVAPGRVRTKMKAEAFARLTGWEERCSEHARDAALLVFGREDV